MSQITDNLEEIRNELPQGVCLVAVSKFKPLEAVMEAYGAGQRVFGENRPQEMAAKAAEAPKDIQWHMIGHLQTNKIKLVVPCAAMIESVDSVHLLTAIDSCAASLGRVVDCLLEVHIASEESKQGFSREEILDLVPHFKVLTSVRFRGLMGMASLTADSDQVRSEFRSLKMLFDEVRKMLSDAGRADAAAQFDCLSMGMSGDWPIAVEEGATHIRIGTRIFGARN